MRSDIKRVLEEAFVVPEPRRKKEFFKEVGGTSISTFAFMKLQISYIRKSVWLVSILVLILAMVSKAIMGKDCIWMISAMMPFIALCMIAESARTEMYGMAELEQASRFSLKSVMYARLSIIGITHLILLGMVIPFAKNGILISYIQLGIYILVPYLLTSTLGLMIVRRVRGKENIYFCAGISVMVSYLNLLIKDSFQQIYDEKWFIWWVCVFAYLLVKVCSEYKKVIYRTEDMLWN